MKIISHRGNLNGCDVNHENKINQIQKVIYQNGYDVEIDIWRINNKLYLGHDNPEDEVCESFLTENNKFLWIHCKNIEALDFFSKQNNNLNYFFHQKDDCTLTSKNFIWVYPGKKFTHNSVIVENNITSFQSIINQGIHGICTDYPNILGTMLSV